MIVIPLLAALYNVPSSEARRFVEESTRSMRVTDHAKLDLEMPETVPQMEVSFVYLSLCAISWRCLQYVSGGCCKCRPVLSVGQFC